MLKQSFLACIVLYTALAAAQSTQQPQITVFGTAEAKVTPNQMNWTLTVLNEGKKLDFTAKEHAETLQKVLDFLKSLGIDQEKLQTSRMQFGENWEYTNSKRIKTGYFASTDVTFQITDLNLYEKLWFGLSQIEKVSIQNVTYDHSDRIRLQNESRQKALLAAREKAAAMAQALGSEIGKPLQIEEQFTPGAPIPYAKMAANVGYGAYDGGQPQILQPGQITITTEVRVIFELKN